MSNAALVAAAIGRDWNFLLTIGQWMKLQAAFGKIGPAKISERLAGDSWTVEEVREVIERGLEGGGTDATAARAVATEIMDGQPLMQSFELATDIIGAGWSGMEELTKKKAFAKALMAIPSMTRTGNGTSATSSAPDSSAVSSRAKSNDSASGNISS